MRLAPKNLNVGIEHIRPVEILGVADYAILKMTVFHWRGAETKVAVGEEFRLEGGSG